MRSGVRNILIILFLPLMILPSCAKNGIATAPGNSLSGTREILDTSDAGLRMLWGFWEIRGDIRTGEIEIIPHREVAARLNALVFLEPPPMTYLKLSGPVKINGNEVEFTIALTHPFFGETEFTAFDVKGILMTQANDARYPGPLIALANEEVTHMMNPDGYTLWWGAHLFPPGGEWPNQGYIDGLLGTPDEIVDFAPGINAYKYFCDDLGPDDDLSLIDAAHRGMFSAGATNMRKYKIKVIGGVFEVNYAVDANWAWPTPVPPVSVPDDFPIHANQPEAYRIDVTEVKNTLYHDGYYAGGDLILDVTVYTWRDPSTTLAVLMEVPEVMSFNFSREPVEIGYGWARFRVEALTCTPQGTGPMRVLIGVQTSLAFLVSDFGNDPYHNYYSYPVTAFFDHHTEIGSTPPTDGNPGEIRGISYGEFIPISSLPNYYDMRIHPGNHYTSAIKGDHVVIPYSGEYLSGKDAIGIFESFDGGLSFTTVEFDVWFHGNEMHAFIDDDDGIHLVIRDGSGSSVRIRYYNKPIGGDPSGALLDSAFDDRLFDPIGARPFVDNDDILHICYGDYSYPGCPQEPRNIYEITTANYQDFYDPVVLVEDIIIADWDSGCISPVFSFADDGEIFTAFLEYESPDFNISFSHGFSGNMTEPVKLNISAPTVYPWTPGITFAGSSTKDCFVIWENKPCDPQEVINQAPVQGVFIPYGLNPSQPFDLAYCSNALAFFQPSSNDLTYVCIFPLRWIHDLWVLEKPNSPKLATLTQDGMVKGNINLFADNPDVIDLPKYIFTDAGVISLARLNDDNVYNVSIFSPFDKY